MQYVRKKLPKKPKVKKPYKEKPKRPKFLVHIPEVFPIGVCINISRDKKGIVEIHYRKTAEKVLTSFLNMFIPERKMIILKKMHTNKFKSLYKITAVQEMELLEVLENPPTSFHVAPVKTFGRMFR